MRRVVSFLCIGFFCLACRSSETTVKPPDDSPPLPDLIIKKVTYRLPPTAPTRIPERGGVFQPTYEIQLQIDNIGNAPFSEPFMISYSTNLIDFQSVIYSKQERFNDTRMIIAPGKSMTFSMVSEVEIPLSTVSLSTLPMRFLLNYDWKSYMSRPETVSLRESNYDNNSYELSMRIQMRR